MDFGAPGYQTLAGVPLYSSVTGDQGLTGQQTDEFLCNGVAGAPVTVDGGSTYDTYSFGQNGEVVLEYNSQSGIDYKLSAVNAGYRAPMYLSDSIGDNYVLTIGNPIKNNDAAVDADFPGPGTTPKIATALSNAFMMGTCGLPTPDNDCVDAGDCTVSYDSSGNMVVGFVCYQATPPLGVVIAHDSNTAAQFFATNPNGQ